MSWLELLLILLGFAVGAYGTVVGAGGGFVLVPILLLVYPDESPATITSISLAVVFFNALSGSLAYARLHRIDYVAGMPFALAALPGAIAGALFVHRIPRDTFDLIFALLLLGVATYTIWSAGRTAIMREPLRGRFVVRRYLPGSDPGTTYRYSYNVLHGSILSAAIGFISSLFGIGGGVILVPLMVNLLQFPIHVAAATSQFILLFMAGEGSAVHLINGELTGDTLVRALLISIGAIPGAQVGARAAQRLRGKLIAQLLAAALFVVGARLLYGGLT